MACGGGGGGGTTPAKKIALLLPESKTARYESKDRPFFTAKLQALCPSCQLIYSNANQDAPTQQTQAEAALGALQGTALLTALNGKANASVVMINGDPADNNAKLFKQGAHSILDGKVNIKFEYDTPSWSPDKAQQEMAGALVALKNKVDGVLAANDGTGGGAIAAMKAAGVTPLPPVTGQDAELAAIQRILLGEQYMTVYKAIKAEAEAAATLAFDLATGASVPSSMTNGKTVNNGSKDIASVLLTPVAVTKSNIKDTVVADGFWSKTDICTSQYASACTAAGIA